MLARKVRMKTLLRIRDRRLILGLLISLLERLQLGALAASPLLHEQKSTDYVFHPISVSLRSAKATILALHPAVTAAG